MTEQTTESALIAAIADMANPSKNKTNPAFGSQYADLEAVLASVKPHLTEHGLAVVQMPVTDEHGVGVETVIYGPGEMLDMGRVTLPLGKPTAQAGGSAITYARRYALAAIFGLAQVDDDGNTASETPKGLSDMEAAAKLKALKEKAATTDSLEALNKALGNPTSMKSAVAIYKAMSDTERGALQVVADGGSVEQLPV